MKQDGKFISQKHTARTLRLNSVPVFPKKRKGGGKTQLKQDVPKKHLKQK